MNSFLYKDVNKWTLIDSQYFIGIIIGQIPNGNCFQELTIKLYVYLISEMLGLKQVLFKITCNQNFIGIIDEQTPLSIF